MYYNYMRFKNKTHINPTIKLSIAMVVRVYITRYVCETRAINLFNLFLFFPFLFYVESNTKKSISFGTQRPTNIVN